MSNFPTSSFLVSYFGCGPITVAGDFLKVWRIRATVRATVRARVYNRVRVSSGSVFIKGIQMLSEKVKR